MPNETLEDKLKESESKSKSNIWDFMVSAYSSSKAVKLVLLTAAAGYSYSLAVAVAGMFYLGAKTAGVLVKNAARFIAHPIKYTSSKGIKEMISDTAELYNPFGKYKRPTFMGAILSYVTHITGF